MSLKQILLENESEDMTMDPTFDFKGLHVESAKRLLRLLKEKGYDIEPVEENGYLGSGTFGSVFRINGDRVLKIGTIGFNADASILQDLIKEQPEGIVRIYGHLETPFYIRLVKDKLFVTIMEYLDTSTSVSKEVSYYSRVDLEEGDGDFDYFEERTGYTPPVFFDRTFGGNIDPTPFEEFMQELDRDENTTFYTDMYKAATWFYKSGHAYFDFHEGNVGRDPKTGHYKLIDVF